MDPFLRGVQFSFCTPLCLVTPGTKIRIDDTYTSSPGTGSPFDDERSDSIRLGSDSAIDDCVAAPVTKEPESVFAVDAAIFEDREPILSSLFLLFGPLGTGSPFDDIRSNSVCFGSDSAIDDCILATGKEEADFVFSANDSCFEDGELILLSFFFLFGPRLPPG